jgi:hypothetical protein
VGEDQEVMAWTMSQPMDMWTVQGMPVRQQAAARLRSLCGTFFLLDDAAGGLAQTLVSLGSLDGDVIEARGFLPEADLADLDPAGHVLGGAAHQGQLKVVDQASAVGCQVGDETVLDQVDEEAGQAQFDGVGSRHQDDGSTLAKGNVEGVDQG